MKQYRLNLEHSRKIEVFNSQKAMLIPIMRMEHPHKSYAWILSQEAY
jgi:hypothetical protein